MNEAPQFDVVVIGAGIHGAGVAQAAAAAGYSVLVVEQYAAPAQGTSSRSSKLIHGGLRYLERGALGLVYECLRERRLLLRNAPTLVKAIPFYLPVYTHSTRPAWLLYIGLWIYRVLAGWSGIANFKRVPQHEWSQLDGLNTQNLRAVFQYYDAQTDDAALTAAVLASAQRLGAVIKYSTVCERLQLQSAHVDVAIRNQAQALMVLIEAKVVVNAAGPWVNHVARKVQPTVPVHDIEWVQGAHIVLPSFSGAAQQGIYYVEAPDGRPVFIMPWRGNILVGTTETIFHGEPANVTATEVEIDYLLKIYNQYFGKTHLRQHSDILETFAGLRVLPKDSIEVKTKSVAHNNLNARSRETLFVQAPVQQPRYFAIYGGKLTAYRATAEQILKQLRQTLPRKLAKANSRTLTLN